VSGSISVPEAAWMPLNCWVLLPIGLLREIDRSSTASLKPNVVLANLDGVT
jgi:hypothetical protein